MKVWDAWGKRAIRGRKKRGSRLLLEVSFSTPGRIGEWASHRRKLTKDINSAVGGLGLDGGDIVGGTQQGRRLESRIRGDSRRETVPSKGNLGWGHNSSGNPADLSHPSKHKVKGGECAP